MADYADIISEAEARYALPSGLLHGLITRGERSGERAVSPKGARGLAQLMPGTARDLGVSDPFDPQQSIDGGARYLRQQLDAFGGDQTLAVAAYNAGPGAVRKYGGVPPFRETQAYVQRVTGGAEMALPTDKDIDALFGASASSFPAAAPRLSARSPSGTSKSLGPQRTAMAGTNGDDAIEIDINSSTHPEYLAWKGGQTDPELSDGAIDGLFGDAIQPEAAIGGGYAAAKDHFAPLIERSVAPLPNLGPLKLRDWSLDRLSNARGLTAGYLDEAMGGIAYGGTVVANKVAPLMGKAVPYSPEEAARATTDTLRGLAAADERRRPIANFTNQVAGSFGLPGVRRAGEFVAGGKKALDVVGRSALVGGAYGALTESGNAEGGVAPRAQAALRGGLFGSVMGAVPAAGAPVIAKPTASLVEAITPLFSKVASRAGDAAPRVSRLLKSGGELLMPPRRREASFDLSRRMNLDSPAAPIPVLKSASQTVERPGSTPRHQGPPSTAPRLSGKAAKVPRLIARSLERDELTPNQYAASLAGRSSAEMPFERGGENLVGLAELVAQSPGPGRNLAVERLAQRSGSAPDRVKAQVGEGLGGAGDYFSTMDKIIAKRAQESEPFFQRAYSQPIDADIFNRQFEPILRRLPKGTLEKAYDIARREGRNPEELGLMTSDSFAGLPGRNSEGAAGAGGVVGMSQNEPVQVVNPTLETLHYVKMGLDEMLEGYRNPVTRRLELWGSPAARADSSTRRSLGAAMRDVSPDYKQAMAIWGEESAHKDALELGRDVFSGKFPMQYEQLRRAWREMGRTEQDFYRKGVGEALVAKVRSSGGGVNTMRQLLRSEEFRDRVRLAFPGQEAYDRFIQSAATEVQMQNRSNQVLGNSATFRRDAQRDAANEDGFGAADVVDAAIDLKTGNGDGLTRRLARAFARNQDKEARNLMNDPEVSRLLGEALFGDDDLISQLLTAELRRRRASGTANRLAGALALPSSGGINEAVRPPPRKSDRSH